MKPGTNYLPLLFLFISLMACSQLPADPETPLPTATPPVSLALQTTPTATFTPVPSETAVSPTASPSLTPPAALTPRIIPTDTPVPAFPAGQLELSIVNRIGLPNERFIVYNNHAYLQTGEQLFIVDINDPAHPQQIGNLLLPLQHVQGMTLTDNILVIFGVPFTTVDFTPGLILFLDLTQPAQPVIAGSFEVEEIADVALSWPYVYALAGDQAYFPFGVYVLEASDLANVQSLAFYEVPDVSETLYLLANEDEMTVIVGDWQLRLSIDNPASLVAMEPNTQTIPVPTAPPGPYLYKLTADSFQIYDTTSTLIGELVRPVFHADQVVVAGSWMYVLEEPSRLLVLDVSAHQTPQRIAEYTLPNILHLFAVGSLPGLITGEADGGTTLSFLEVQDPQQPTLIGTTSMNNWAGIRDVVVDLPYLYVSDAQGLHIVSLADANAPQTIGFYPVTAIQGVTAVDQLLFLALPAGLSILDVSNPASPQEIGSTTLPITEEILECRLSSTPSETVPAHDVAVIGSYAYIPSGSICWSIVDVSDPALPQVLVAWQIGYCTHQAVTAYNNLLFTVGTCPSLDSIGQLSTFNLDGSQVIQATSLEFTDYSMPPFAVSGNRVYLVDDNEGILVVEITASK